MPEETTWLCLFQYYRSRLVVTFRFVAGVLKFNAFFHCFSFLEQYPCLRLVQIVPVYVIVSLSSEIWTPLARNFESNTVGSSYLLSQWITCNGKGRRWSLLLLPTARMTTRRHKSCRVSQRSIIHGHCFSLVLVSVLVLVTSPAGYQAETAEALSTSRAT